MTSFAKALYFGNPVVEAYAKSRFSLLISFSIASWGLSQPLYGYVVGNNVFDTAGANDILILMFVYQALPMALLFSFDRAIARIKFRDVVFLRLWRVSLYMLATLVVLRNLQLSGYVSVLDRFDSPIFMLFGIVSLAIAGSLVFYYYRLISCLFVYLSAASLIITAVFVADVGLFGRAWDTNSEKWRESYLQVNAGNKTLNPVFLIVFDALGGEVLFKDGQIDNKRFPHLAGLGLDSAVFDNATSNHIDTTKSFGTMLSGRMHTTCPKAGSGSCLTPFHQQEQGLIGSMVSAGYSAEFHSTVLQCRADEGIICQDKSMYGVESPHDAAKDFVDWFLPEAVLEQIRRVILGVLPPSLSNRLLTLTPRHRGDLPLWDGFVESISSEASLGRFYLIHSFISHRPYVWDSDGNLIMTQGIRSQSRSDFDAMSVAYENQVMFLDRQVGKFVSKLKGQDLYDDATIIITGDHGPRKLGLRHFKHSWGDISEYPSEIDRMVPWVPVIIKSSRVKTGTRPTEYQHLDLFATMLDVLDIPDKPIQDGKSIFSPLRPEREKVFYTYPEAGGRVKYIYAPYEDKWLKEN